MSQDLRTLELFAEANPVPDELALDTTEVAAAEYLATLRQRSSAMTQLDERTEIGKNRNKTKLMIAAAAVVAVLLGVVVFALTQGPEEPPVITQPPAETGTVEGYWEQGSTRVLFDGDLYFIINGEALVDTGRYTTIGNDSLTLRSLEGTVNCQPQDGGTWSYQAGADTLALTYGSDDCDAGRGLGVGTLNLNRTAPFETPEPAPTDTSDLEGTWVLDTVAFSFEAGSYSMAVDGILVDSGSYTIRDTSPGGQLQHALTLTSDQDTVACSPGDVGRWSYSAGEDLALNGEDDVCFFRAFVRFFPGVYMPTDALNLTAGDLELAGSWENDSASVTFENGNYSFSVDGEAIDSGTFEVLTSPYRVALTPASSTEECGPVEYEFALQQDEPALSLETSQDGGRCPARAALGSPIADFTPVASR